MTLDKGVSTPRHGRRHAADEKEVLTVITKDLRHGNRYFRPKLKRVLEILEFYI